MSKFRSSFRLFANRIFIFLALFILPIISIIAIGSSSTAFSPQPIAQRITSPGLTTPTPTPTPPSTPASTEVVIPIPVPFPKNPLPSGTKPTAPIPTAQPVPTPPQFATNHTNRVISPGERTKISAYLSSRNLNSNLTVTSQTDPRFILHDTSVLMSPATLDRERQTGRGPLGLGVNIYLPRENMAVIARPNFYELRRPTTTEFEKASDILDLQDREQLFREVWGSIDDDARRQALDTALANLNLSSAEIAKEQAATNAKLAAESGRIFTTGTWAVEAVCSRYNGGDQSIAEPNQADALRNACGTLDNYFKIRNSRVKSSVTTEIIQVGARSSKGNQNTCSASNPNIATFPKPPYSENQYAAATALYLRAALAAGKFPQMTTHFALDAFASDAHCDPRCFNLNKLYSSLAAVMGHAPGSSYGIKPSYGTKGGVNNIWWDDRICHGSAP
jgi:hypothetical protein